MRAGVELKLDINQIKYQTFNIENKNDIVFSSHIVFDPENRNVQIEPSALSIAGLELETWGTYEFRGEPGINMAFRATNTGLEVLNFLFLGVLDLDEIEQIGSGSIHLDGSVTGSLGEALPIVSVNGFARGIGFRINAIEKDVNDISFALFATNGGKADLSEARIEMKNFTASFPEGSIQGNINAINLVRPEVDLALKGELNLAGLEKVIKMEKLHSIEGHVRFDSKLSGIVDRRSDKFLNEAGSTTLTMDSVGLVFGKDTLRQLGGELYMDGYVTGCQGT